MANEYRTTRLRGRGGECAALDALISQARAGTSTVLVLRGEPGVGKTTLLDYVADRAAGFRCVRVTSVESEMEIAFAGLQQLCAPLLGHLDALPPPQREALNVAFGRSSGAPPGRFLIGLAVLALFAAAADDQPLACLVDDAQWLDEGSAQALAFVARRLGAERVAVVFAVRTDVGNLVSELPTLPIHGLAERDAQALLADVVLGRLDGRIRDRIVAETRGNPLALMELSRERTAEELAGGFGRPDVWPVMGRLDQTFAKRLQELPVNSRRLLLVAAAEPTGDVRLLARAAERLGIALEAVGAAEAAGLIEVGAGVRFRHPVVRSVAYRVSDPTERRNVHHVLAEVTDPTIDPDRHAWHRANAASGPDEAVATALERSADRARGRGGVAAAAAFLTRATELTLDPARLGARAIAAARAKREVASLHTALELVATAELAPLDERQQAELARLHAQIELTRSRGGDGNSLPVCAVAVQLRNAAARFEPLDDGLAAETYMEALTAAMYGGRTCAAGTIHDTATRARFLAQRNRTPRTVDVLLEGLSSRFTDGHARSVPAMRRALAAIRADADHDDGDILSWPWQAFPIGQETIVHELWDDEMWHHLAEDAVRRTRNTGALALLPVALSYRAGVHVHAGEFDLAAELLAEADAITAATGAKAVKYHSLTLLVYGGREAEAQKLIADAVTDGMARGEGRTVGLTGCAAAILNNGLGKYDVAFADASRATEFEDLGMFGWGLVELIEAGTRSGHVDAAGTALERLQERVLATNTRWAAGVLARSRALLAEPGVAEKFYCEAIDELAHTRVRVHLARAHLVYGEWLRRANRRLDAREQLRTAQEMFDRMGAAAFAERARRELAATGDKVRKRRVDTGDALTPQEAQIARLAGDGLTNPEIGAQLFLSAHTVEWHLRKVFAKLGITSRRQLRRTPPPQ